MRFGVCRSEPRSAYHLVGEPFVRNASKAIGVEKELSFLWNDFDHKQLDKQIAGIGLPLGNLINASGISALATSLEQLVQVPLEAMDVREIQNQVEGMTSKDQNAVELKTALQQLQQAAAGQPAFVFKAETIKALKDTKALQDQIDKVAAMIEPYKKNLADVVKGYGDYVVSQIKDTVGNCAPAYAMYESTVNVVCDGIVKPFGGFWFSVASCLAVGTVAMFMALCMSTLYSRKPRPPLPPPAPKSEPYFEVLDQPL
ncbi:hypothetical protein V5799_027601 [Amblyomma americanum]|uniref:Uncharacterized protein n=1 Tax=Amblyomma americanum TaxID=6943 RepID=A0AAQ4DF87_AMBAM